MRVRRQDALDGAVVRIPHLQCSSARRVEAVIAVLVAEPDDRVDPFGKEVERPGKPTLGSQRWPASGVAGGVSPRPVETRPTYPAAVAALALMLAVIGHADQKSSPSKGGAHAKHTEPL
jgi:hypothetical protein